MLGRHGTLDAHSLMNLPLLIVDDFCHLQYITDTNELRLEYVLQKRRRPQVCEKLALTEAIGHQLSREVWRILAHG